MTERRGYRVMGTVQGVGFRWWVRDAATRLGLRGWVRNEPDGTVRVEAEGAADALDRLEALLRSGPPAARVDDLRHEAPSSRQLPEAFEIAR
jgi:acylphosphatase